MLKLGKTWAKDRLSPVFLSYGIAFLVFLVFILWRLGDLLPGASAAEIEQKNLVLSLHSLQVNLADAPLRLLQHVFWLIHPDRIVSFRLASAFFALIISFCFYGLARSWFGRIIGFLGTLLFISLPLFSISARQATTQIMLFSPLILMFLYTKAIKTEKGVLWTLLAVAAGLLLYTPGMLWWIIGAMALSYRKLSAVLSEVSRAVSATMLGIMCLLIVPIIVVGIKHPSSLKQLLLIPSAFDSPLRLGSHFLHMLGALFVKMPNSSPLVLGTLPILNILLLALVIFGAYAMRAAARDKTIVLGAVIFYGLLVASLNNNFIYLIFCVPALLIFATAGLRYLYIEWRTIFPRNPVPKTFALILIAAVALSQLYYSLHYTLMAWPHSMPARSAYVIK